MDDIEGTIRAYGTIKMSIDKARAKRNFLVHLATYVIGNIFFGAWNALTYFVKDSPALWFYLPLLFWGVGLIVHYLLSVALFDEWWDMDERTIRERLKG